MGKQQSRVGVKALIVIAAVGSTLGGWAYFAGTTPASDNKAAARPIVLPTLVPIDDAISASQTVLGQPQAQTQRPQSQALRSITIPQPPMAMSRSSR